MSEIVVGSWVGMKGMKGAVPLREGRVTEVRRRTGEPYALDEVCVVTADGTAYGTVRGSLMLVDEPAAAAAAAAPLKDEVAELEAELERRDKASREKYAALERDRDLVENAMREASARAQRNEDNLKAVLVREDALKATLESERGARTAASQSLDHERQVAYNALRDAETQAKRADVWQAAAADALAQAASWRDKYENERQECVRMHERLAETQGRVVELMQSKGVHDGE
jgi:chromosome segregation ATPase